VPDAPRLPPDTVVVRWLELETISSGSWPGLLEILDRSERARAELFRRPQDRDAFVAAHALTRLMLSRYSGRAASSWRFANGPYGKPEIAEPSVALRFNLSHTDGLVASAVACEGHVGVDVERLDDRRLGMDLAEQTFAPAEVAHLRSLPAAARTEAAFELWTLKEAYVKATGFGLHCPLDSFWFTLDPVAVRFSAPSGDEARRWVFRCLRPTPTHVLALAVRYPRPGAVRIEAGAMTAAEFPP
jgi:4'-phosphopantetheinyl transferase